MDQLRNSILGLLSEVCGRDGIDEIRSEDYLGADLGMTSLQVVQLAAKIQNSFPDKIIHFQELLIPQGGAVKTDIRVDELVAFLQKNAGLS